MNTIRYKSVFFENAETKLVNLITLLKEFCKGDSVEWEVVHYLTS